MTTQHRIAAAAAALLAVAQAQALEAYKTYDEFTAANPLSQTLWASSERTREIRNGELVMIQRDWGATAADAFSTGVSFGTGLSSPERVTQLRARVRMNSYTVTACAPNPTPTSVRARLVATFFNTGNRTPGSQSGDMLGQIGVRRSSASVAPANELEVYASLVVCSNADCSLSQLVGSLNLGTTTLGTNLTMLMEWDKPTKQVRFSRDNGLSFQSIAYTQFDGEHPGALSRSVGTRVDAANCATAPRTQGFVEAAFDNIAVNKNAKP